MTTEFHVASLLLQVFPEQMASVRESIMNIDKAEPSVNNEVKLVVVLEGTTSTDITKNISFIGNLPGVLSTTLVYQHREEFEEDEL